MNNNMDNSTSPIKESTLPTRKRGRPRKEKVTTSTSTPAVTSRKRVRPRKVQKVEDRTTADLRKIPNIKKIYYEILSFYCRWN
ncbi:hypothetical protein Glove_23g225 [Diversispora epigaea]|uniref:Uncharacterized protein n=1 Tax=Diversispora epigaea TaxID=1348612 RepID=A0A397JK93_9GLOM|nr:hypothetical protein Glove_23g225 [Diversispora epigaea]